jgi:hypothetical protein
VDKRARYDDTGTYEKTVEEELLEVSRGDKTNVKDNSPSSSP